MATRTNLKENNIDSCLNEEEVTSSDNDSSDDLSLNKELSADFKRKHKNISKTSIKSSVWKPQLKTSRSNYTSPSKSRTLTRVEELSSESEGESNETSSNTNRKNKVYSSTPSRKRKGQSSDSEVKPQKIANNSSATTSPLVIKLKRVADPNSKRSTYERVCSPRKQALACSPKPDFTRPCNHKSPSKLSAKKNLFSPESCIPLKELQLELNTNSDNRLIDGKKESKMPGMFEELESDLEDLEIDINLKGLNELSPSKHKIASSLDSSSELFKINIRSSSKKPVMETTSKKLQKTNETLQKGDYKSPSKVVPNKFRSCNENSPAVAKKSKSDSSPWKRTRRTSTSLSNVMHTLEDDQSRILRSTPKKERKMKVLDQSEEDTAIIQSDCSPWKRTSTSISTVMHTLEDDQTRILRSTPKKERKMKVIDEIEVDTATILQKSADETGPKKPQGGSKTALKEVYNTDATNFVNKFKASNDNSPSKTNSSPSKSDVGSPRTRTRRMSIPSSNLVCNLGSENARILRNTTPKKEAIIEEVDDSEGDIKTPSASKNYCTPQKVLRTYSPRKNSVQKHDDVRKNVLLRGKTPRKESSMMVEEENKQENKSVVGFSTPNKKDGQIQENNICTPFSSSKYNENCGDPSKLSSPLQQKKITVTTPISKKKAGRGFLTPSMAKKKHDTPDFEEDALDATRKQLHISTIPKSLPCRDAEFSQIKAFLLRKIEHSSGGCMYISGVPGTGKTATVHAVIRTLQEQVRREELLDFDFVEVNGLRLTEPKQAYVRIYQALSDRKVTADQAQQLLNKRFSGKCKKSTIILVDELDYLCNRRQDVVYNILDWPTKRSSALVVLTISNTMDLPERTLKGRVTSRMGLTRLVFQPYSFHQLREIVQDRLCGFSTFHPDAVQLVARKVAAVSGDARRALDICRRTTELAEAGQQVTVGMVEQALTQIFSGPRVTVIQRLSGLSQLVLRSLRDVSQRTGLDETIIAQVYKHLLQIVRLEGTQEPTVGTVLQTCVSLVNLGLVVAEKGRMDVTRKLSLNVSSDDIHYALDNIRT